MRIPWSEEMMIGHLLLDSDHEHIVALVNELNDTVSNCANRGLLVNKYCQIIDCLGEHFTREEHIMISSKYPEADCHRKAHWYLFDQLTKMTYLLESNAPMAEKNIITFLNEWFFQHVMISDKKLAAHLLGQQ
ncbi:MAG: hemerythrin family protein [Rhodospirillaceae bacterium]